MCSYCADPSSLEGLTWLGCYLTSGKHIDFYWSFLTVLVLLAITAPIALAFGFCRGHGRPVAGLAAAPAGQGLHGDGARHARHRLLPVLRHRAGSGDRVAEAPDPSARTGPTRSGRGWNSASVPRPRCRSGDSAQVWHRLYGFALAVFTFAIVFGAFAANVLYGAMQAVPRAQLETAEAYGMIAAPGLPPHPGAADVGLCAARACRTCG